MIEVGLAGYSSLISECVAYTLLFKCLYICPGAYATASSTATIKIIKNLLYEKKLWVLKFNGNLPLSH